MQRDFALKHLAELQALQGPSFPPLILFEREITPPPFPIDAFPVVAAEYVKASSEFLQVDTPMVAIPVIGTLSTCVQRKYTVEAKPGHREQLNTFSGVIAASGERKTPSMSTGRGSLQELVESINCDRRPLAEAYTDELKVTRQQIEAALKKAVKATKGVADLQELNLLRARERTLTENPVKELELHTGDTTPEGLLDAAQRNGGSFTVFSDEGGVLSTLAGTRYGTGGPWLDPMLQGFSGSEIKVTRATKAPIKIPNPRLTICVMMQQITIDQMMQNPEFVNRGLLARFLFALPRSFMGRRRYDTEMPPQDVIDEYNGIIKKLLETGITEGQEVIYFDPHAKDYVKAVHDEIEVCYNDEDLGPALRAWVSKLHGQFIRLCGIFHCVSHVADPAGYEIDEYTCANAWTVAKYFWDCAKILYSNAADDPATIDARYILGRIQNKGVTKISRGELLQTCKRFHKAAEMDAGLEVLQERGYIAIERIEGNGRPAINILLNPEARKLE